MNRLDKDNFINVCSQWVVGDCRPFSAVNGSRFKNLDLSLINIGAKYGSYLDISHLIPDATTILKRIEIKAEEKRYTIKEDIRDAVSNEDASVTTDLWTDDYIKKLHFIT